MKDDTGTDRKILRALRFIGLGRVEVEEAVGGGKLLLCSEERGAIAIPKSLLVAITKAGLVERVDGFLSLTVKGRALGKARRTADVVPEGIGELAMISVGGPDPAKQALVDLSESPLAQVARHRTRDGRPFLEAGEVNAGERLRSDYTRGQIMPRLSANWVAAVASGRRSGAGGGVELTEASLAARQRVEKAIAAVGPELSGVLLDVCCYLKGMERVEAERGWPARSAKVVLKSALGVLNRHYDPSAGRHAKARTLHWGSEDFRPSMNG
ncbi:MAG: DUF6456 domain-containing protein [Rhizobiaceae bacterium]